MSADATGWTIRHSPYKGAALLVHLAAADSANDQNGNELWMSVSTLGEKARVARTTASEVVTRMLADGFLEVLVDHRHDNAGFPSRYRFLFPDVPVVFETRAPRGGVSPLGTGGVPGADTNPREPNYPSGYQDPADVTGSREAGPVDDDEGLPDDATVEDIRAHRERHRSRAS